MRHKVATLQAVVMFAHEAEHLLLVAYLLLTARHARANVFHELVEGPWLIRLATMLRLTESMAEVRAIEQ